jgi:transitional endoplasmic reticulum ATPase
MKIRTTLMASKTTNKKQKTLEGKGQQQESPPPAWAAELAIKYQSAIAHAFLLHGNVQDYVGGVAGQSLKSYLTASFGERDIIVSWNRASGFSLSTAEMRNKFAEIVEFPLPSSQASSGRAGGFAAGLNQLAGTSVDTAKALEKVRQPGDALDYLNRLLRAKATIPHGGESRPVRAAIIVDYAESIAPASDAAGAENDRSALVTLSEWGRDVAIGERGHIIILVCNELHDLNERLRKSGVRWEQVTIPFPTFEERRDFLRSLLEEDQAQEVKLAPGVSYEDVARMTTGLRSIDLEDIVLRASFHGQDITRALVKQRKDEILATEFEDVLQIAENEFGFEALGGMSEVKEDLRETVIEPLRTGQTRIVPQGLLLMGPAGTGKTRLARALAKEAGVTFVELQPSKIFSKWVGDTERRLERALAAIAGMTPAIVFIDEIDQAVARGESGDNGVSNRVFKRLMEVMSDTTLRGKVLWVAASNRPDLLDAALLRPGRLDKKIPILAPDAHERAAILEVLTVQAFGEGSGLPTAEDYQTIAEQMVDYTGAEIEGVVGKATQLRARSHDSLSIAQVLQTAYERIIPTTQNIDYMTRLALLHCNDLDLVPAHLRDLARQLRHPQARAELTAEQEPYEQPQRRTRKRDW